MSGEESNSEASAEQLWEEEDELYRAFSGRWEGAFRPAPSRQRGGRHKGSFQQSVLEAKARSSLEELDPRPGRTPYSSVRPLLIPAAHPRANAPLRGSDLRRLLNTITQRDEVILSSLDSYRYLDLRQLQQLFFPSPRPAQIRLQHLTQLGLVYRWKAIRPPGYVRLPSVFALSTRGARMVAALREEDPRPLVRRAQHAQHHGFHVVHDLEANGFFIFLALASRALPDQGLSWWGGEAALRAHYREGRTRDHRRTAPAPDGRGLYRTPEGEVQFDLEWDRGTESAKRLRHKVDSYVGYFTNRRQAEFHHVLFVVPGATGEAVVRWTVEHIRFPIYSFNCCRFWVTSRRHLDLHGPLGQIWLYARPEHDPYDMRKALWQPPADDGRLSLLEMPMVSSGKDDPTACIGKPGWWDRRAA